MASRTFTLIPTDMQFRVYGPGEAEKCRRWVGQPDWQPTEDTDSNHATTVYRGNRMAVWFSRYGLSFGPTEIIDTVAHEASHCVEGLAYRMGGERLPDGEMRAYYTGWFAARIFDHIRTLTPRRWAP